MINRKQLGLFGLAILAVTGLSSCGDDDNTPVITPPTASAIINAEVGGATQPNQVFVDFSSETQTAVARNSWDLGFTNGSEFRVILNKATSALAYQLDATDLNAVSAADTAGLGNQLDIDVIFGAIQGPPAPWLAEAVNWIDDPSGDLNGTAIEAISETDAENNVYIINRGKNPDGSQRGWVKIRVIRNGQGYTLQHAEIAATSFDEISISKNSDFNFNYVSLNTGAVSVEPASDSWDIAFTTFTTLLPVGPTVSIPYLFNDYVIQNRNGVSVASLEITDTQTYESFSFDNLSGQTLSTQLTTIGSSWRTVAQPGSPIPTGVNTDVFYLVRDAAGNYYKLRFNRMLNPETGERGFPQIQYDLLTQQ